MHEPLRIRAGQTQLLMEAVGKNVATAPGTIQVKVALQGGAVETGFMRVEQLRAIVDNADQVRAWLDTEPPAEETQKPKTPAGGMRAARVPKPDQRTLGELRGGD